MRDQWRVFFNREQDGDGNLETKFRKEFTDSRGETKWSKWTRGLTPLNALKIVSLRLKGTNEYDYLEITDYFAETGDEYFDFPETFENRTERVILKVDGMIR